MDPILEISRSNVGFSPKAARTGPGPRNPQVRINAKSTCLIKIEMRFALVLWTLCCKDSPFQIPCSRYSGLDGSGRMYKTFNFGKGCIMLLVFCTLMTIPVHGQPAVNGVRTDSTSQRTPIPGCRVAVAAVSGGVMLGTYLALDKVWYAQYEREELHVFDDSGEWEQLDKAGHLFSAYTLGRWGHAGWRMCGTKKKGSILVGGSFGFLFLTGIELLDGTSAGWGFSWSDMAANALGTGLFMGQQLGWNEQRFQMKLSAHLTEYAKQRPDVLGEGLGERVLKDYNGQTIWLSANPWSFAKQGSFPKWLNIAFGYGAEGMISAFRSEHDLMPGAGRRYRQFYLSPDLDLTKIRTRSKLLRSVLFVLNGIKIPMPALEVRSTGKVVGHWLYF